MQDIQVSSLGREDALEKKMASHSSILAWEILWSEEPGELQSTGSQKLGHDWAANTFTFSHKIDLDWTISCMITVALTKLILSQRWASGHLLRYALWTSIKGGRKESEIGQREVQELQQIPWGAPKVEWPFGVGMFASLCYYINPLIAPGLAPEWSWQESVHYSRTISWESWFLRLFCWAAFSAVRGVSSSGKELENISQHLTWH